MGETRWLEPRVVRWRALPLASARPDARRGRPDGACLRLEVPAAALAAVSRREAAFFVVRPELRSGLDFDCLVELFRSLPDAAFIPRVVARRVEEVFFSRGFSRVELFFRLLSRRVELLRLPEESRLDEDSRRPDDLLFLLVVRPEDRFSPLALVEARLLELARPFDRALGMTLIGTPGDPLTERNGEYDEVVTEGFRVSPVAWKPLRASPRAR